MVSSRSFRLLAASAALLALAACGRPSDSAYYNRGGPDTLLDVSNEVVNLSVAGPNELSQLSMWIEQDQPSRAELYCAGGDLRCVEARKVLESHGVPVLSVPSSDNSVALVYERILARDCNQRYVDNNNNNWNAPHPAFGCSVAANIIQHVSDKQQFVNPALTDPAPATGAVATYGRAYAPPPANKGNTGVGNSIVGSSIN